MNTALNKDQNLFKLNTPKSPQMNITLELPPSPCLT